MSNSVEFYQDIISRATITRTEKRELANELSCALYDCSSPVTTLWADVIIDGVKEYCRIDPDEEALTDINKIAATGDVFITRLFNASRFQEAACTKSFAVTKNNDGRYALSLCFGTECILTFSVSKTTDAYNKLPWITQPDEDVFSASDLSMSQYIDPREPSSSVYPMGSLQILANTFCEIGRLTCGGYMIGRGSGMSAFYILFPLTYHTVFNIELIPIKQAPKCEVVDEDMSDKE